MVLVICLLALLMVLPYVLGPVLVRKQFRHKKEPELVPVALADMPPEARAHLEQVESELLDEGFELAGRVRIDTVPNATAWASLLIHRENRDLAQAAAAARVLAGDAYAVEERQVEFMTQWKARDLLTNNSSQVMPFGPLRGQSVLRFVDMDDVCLLYRIHRARVASDDAAGMPLLPPPGQEMEVIADSVRRFVEAQAARGYLRPLEDLGEYGLTWRGAFIATWKHLWPFQARELGRAREAARRLVATLDFDVPEDQVTPHETARPVATSKSA